MRTCELNRGDMPLQMGTCQNDWLVTGPLAHTHYIPRYMGYVTEGGFRDIPKDFCPAEDMKAARQGVCNRLALQGVCNGHPQIMHRIMKQIGRAGSKP